MTGFVTVQQTVALQVQTHTLAAALEELERVLLVGKPMSVVDTAAYQDPTLAGMLLELAEVNADVLDYLGVTQKRDSAVVYERLLAMRRGLASLELVVQKGEPSDDVSVEPACRSV